jgi:hypothetical protein
MSHRLCVALALCLTLLPFSATAQTPPLIPLKIGIIPIESAAEAFYAVEMGFFKQQGLDVQLEMMQNGSAIAAAVEQRPRPRVAVRVSGPGAAQQLYGADAGDDGLGKRTNSRAEGLQR